MSNDADWALLDALLNDEDTPETAAWGAEIDRQADQMADFLDELLEDDDA